MPRPAVAHFASLRSNLMVIVRAAEPRWEGGRQVATIPGDYIQFENGIATVEGQRKIDFIREAMKEGLEVWELEGANVRPVTDVLQELALADVDGVRAILADERDNANRDTIVQTALKILEKLGVAERRQGQTVS